MASLHSWPFRPLCQLKFELESLVCCKTAHLQGTLLQRIIALCDIISPETAIYPSGYNKQPLLTVQRNAIGARVKSYGVTVYSRSKLMREDVQIPQG